METHQENTTEKVALKDEDRISWRDILSGKVMLKPRITKQYRVVFLVFILCLAYIGNKLECEQQERKIERMKVELLYEEIEFHRAIKTLNEEELLEKVMEKLKKNQLDLKVPNTPPFTY